MLKSMTGFGRGAVQSENYSIIAEMKAVNHRFLEISVRLPKQLAQLEDNVKKAVQERLSRGKVDVFITFEQLTAKNSLVKVDKELAIAYHIALSEMANACSIPSHLEVRDLASLPGVLSLENPEQDIEEIAALLSRAVEEALIGFIHMREAEGASLSHDLAQRLDRIEAQTAVIAAFAPQVVAEQHQRLEQRIKELLGAVELDQNRLANELAFYADKVDISEELTRLASHCGQFRLCLEANEPIGRKLDFIIQEMLRESNTIGSKSNALTVNQAVIEVKSELEKIREQIQNIE